MALNILEICTQALDGTNVDPPTALVGGDDLGLQLLAIANETGKDIAKRYDWQALVTEASFTTVAAETQVTLSSSFPYIRKILEETMWNRTQQRRVIGSVSSRDWQRYLANGVGPATLIYRIRGGKIIFPSDTAVASETVYFEYIDSRPFVNAAGTTYYENIAADTNLPRIDDEAMILGVRWRFLKRKGLEYGEEFRAYEDQIAERAGNDSPHEVKNLNPYRRKRGNDYSQIPEGDWNQ